jgi:hypothetical protein
MKARLIYFQQLLVIPGCLLVLLHTSASYAQQPELLAGTMSPDKKVALAKEGPEFGEKNFYFLNTATGEKLGRIFSGELNPENPSFVASWNPSSSKVAVLVYFGVRSSRIELFRLNAQRYLERVKFSAPDPLSMYGKPDLKKLAEEHVKASENSLGPWINNDSVRLVSGVMIDQGDDTFRHLFITFTATLRQNVEIAHAQIQGPYTDREAREFLERWGSKYWQEPETDTD